MKRSKIKIIAAVLGIFLLLFVGSLYYLSTKITPEEVRKQTLTFLTKNMPGASVQLGEVNYSFGTSLKFKLNNLQIKLKDEPHSPLASINVLDVKIPIWAILTGGGTVGININAPILHYTEIANNQNNWNKALKSTNENVEKSTSTKKSEEKNSVSEKKSLALPAALSRSKLDLKLTNLVLKYSLLNKTKGDVEISRFFIKNLNFKSATAFEVASQIHQKAGKNEEISMEAVLIGQLNLGHYLENQELNSTMVLSLNNVKLPGLKKDISAIKADMKLNLKKDGLVDLDLDAGLGSMGYAKLKIQLLKEKINIDIRDVDISIKETLDIVGQEGLVNSDTSRMKIKGKAEIDHGEINPKIEFQIQPAINFAIAPKVNGDFTASGELLKDQVSLKVLGKILHGTLDLVVKVPVNLKAEKMEDKIGLANVQISMNGVQIPKDDLREAIYSKQKNEEIPKDENSSDSSSKQASNKSKVIPAPILPKVTAQIKWTNISIGGEPFQGDMKILSQKNTVTSDNVKFTFSKGKGSIKFMTTLLAQGAQNTKLDAQINSLNLDSFMPFLPKNLESLKGTFSGQVKGTVETVPLKKQAQYNFAVSMKAKDGEIKKLNVAEYVTDAIDGIPMLKNKISKDGINLNNKFDSLELNGNFMPDHFQISKFTFVSSKGQLVANGHGDIYPLPNLPESVLEFDLTDQNGKLSKELQKNIGTNSLPLRVSGLQYSMKPDLAYTLKKISKSALKTQGKEQIKKIGEKLLNGNKDGLKNLFNGFLKK